MIRPRANLYYDFDTECFVAELGSGIAGYGQSPQEAVDALRYQCNKHDLWPKEHDE